MGGGGSGSAGMNGDGSGIVGGASKEGKNDFLRRLISNLEGVFYVCVCD